MPLKKPTSRLVPKRPTERYRYVRLRWHLFFAIFDLLGGALFAVIRLLQVIKSTIFRGKQEEDCSEEPVQSILVLQLDHLGDAILSTGMLHVLRKSYPEAQIDILVGPWNRSLFEEVVDDVDRVLVFDGGGRLARTGLIGWLGKITRLGWPLAILRQGLKLRSEQYDLGIDVRGEMPHAALMWIARIRRRVGWSAGGGGFLLTDSPKWTPNRPEIESRRAILKTIGIAPEPHEMLPRLSTVDDDACRCLVSGRACPRIKNATTNVPANDMTASVAANQYAASQYVYNIVLHLTAGTRAKEWPAEHWAELISELSATPSNEIVLVGSPADHIIGQKVESLVTTERSHLIKNLIGRLSLVELACVLKEADLMIGADSGPAHMAAAVGTRTIVLFSGTNRTEQWRPPGEHVTVIEHDVPCRPCHQKQACPVEGHPCMTQITPQQVIKQMREDRGQKMLPHRRKFLLWSGSSLCPLSSVFCHLKKP